MSSHGKSSKKPRQLEKQRKVPASPQPPFPNPVGKKRRIKNIYGEIRHLKIIDQIGRIQSTFPDKYIVFQKIEIEEDRVIEFRLGYYMIGVLPGAKGKWVWGQFCLLIPSNDLVEILDEARSKGWFK